MLTEKDVYTNKVLIRKIRRMQEAELAEAEESSDDEKQAPRSDTQPQPASAHKVEDLEDTGVSDGEMSA